MIWLAQSVPGTEQVSGDVHNPEFESVSQVLPVGEQRLDGQGDRG